MSNGCRTCQQVRHVKFIRWSYVNVVFTACFCCLQVDKKICFTESEKVVLLLFFLSMSFTLMYFSSTFTVSYSASGMLPLWLWNYLTWVTTTCVCAWQGWAQGVGSFSFCIFFITCIVIFHCLLLKIYSTTWLDSNWLSWIILSTSKDKNV